MTDASALTLRDSRDTDPYPLYEALRERGNVVWDAGMSAWLVLDHEGCTFVERREDLFAEPTSAMPGVERISGGRDLRALVGPPHDAMHRSLSREWRPQSVASYAKSMVRPVIAERLAAMASGGRFELFTDVASVVPIAIIARVLGLPEEDDATLRRTKAWLEAVLAWRHTYGRDPEVREAAIDATARLSPMLLDVIRDRRDRPGEDIISWLWAIGPSVASDWDEADVLANTTFLFEAGSETTSLLMCTLVKRLLDEPAHRRAEIIEDADAMRWYTDEVLRHSTVVHWRARRANQDVELGGVRIEAGSMVHPVNAAANRDAARWERPTEFDPSRPGLAGHLAFNIGPRHCAGAHLARLQTTEAVQALFRAFPDIALDKEAPRPEMRGYVSRAWRPVWLRFAPRSADDVRRAALSPAASRVPTSATQS